MKLLNCHIVNFGCLSERSYTFRDGLNVLYAENGSGKSTLAVFLKAMLYGFSAVNKSNLIDNERKRYTPWNGGKFGGSLCFCARGKAYRIERFFGTKEKDDTFKLYDLATQKQSNDFDSKPGNALFGVDADGFERSLYVSQRAPFLPPKNNTIRARLGNLLEAAEDLGSFEEACKKLDTARRSYITTGNRGKVGDLEREMQAKELALSAAKEAEARAEQLLQEAAALRDEKESVLLSLQKARACRAQAEKRRFLEQTSASHRRLCDAVENEASALVPLEAFFGARIPKDEHIAQMEQAVARLEGHEAQLSFCRMNKDEEAALCKLRELYGTLPPENEVSHIRRVFDQYQNAKTQVMDTAPIENAEFDTLWKMFN